MPYAPLTPAELDDLADCRHRFALRRWAAGAPADSRGAQITALLAEPPVAGDTAATLRALHAGDTRIDPAVLHTPELTAAGGALQRDEDGRYVPHVPAAGHRSGAAALHAAAYLTALHAAGIPAADHAVVHVDGQRPQRLAAGELTLLLDSRLRLLTPAAANPSTDPGYGPPVAACRRCPLALLCAAGREAADDVSTVAGVSPALRQLLHHAGITTAAALRGAGSAPPGVTQAVFETLRAQAQMQAVGTARAPGLAVLDRDALAAATFVAGTDVAAVTCGEHLHTTLAGAATIPLRDPAAVTAALNALVEHRRHHPHASVWHHGPALPGRIRTAGGRDGEAAADALLAARVFRDAAALTRRAVRVGVSSYGLVGLRDWLRGDAPVDGCADDLATLRTLLDTLTQLSAQHPPAGPPAAPPEAADIDRTRSPRAQRVDALSAALSDGADPDALPGSPAWTRAWLAAALNYPARELQPEWLAYFQRLAAEETELADDPAVAIAVAVHTTGWQPPTGRQRNPRRELTIRVDPRNPHAIRSGGRAQLAYRSRIPGGDPVTGRVSGDVDVLHAGPDTLVVCETTKPGQLRDAVPFAVLPSSPVRRDPITDALADLAEAFLADADVVSAALTLLRRTPLPAPPAPGEDPVTAVLTALAANPPGSVVAVQGPPGAGKTFVATRVLAALAGAGARIAVTGPSHKAIENLLEELCAYDADVPVGKVPSGPPAADPPRWAVTELAAFCDRQPAGLIVAGTAWNLLNNKLAGEHFDVVAVDEAGQLALPDTMAVATRGDYLLALGDPAQLPHVANGTHPLPVDRSALEHLCDGQTLLPPAHGLFLPVTHRMRDELTVPVSALAYDGQLRAHAATGDRRVDGVPAGLRATAVTHTGNTTYSAAEVGAVVSIVTDLVGRMFHDGAATRPLNGADVLVVAPFNRQVQALTAALAAAGLAGVRVGTVDKFQGQQAAVVVLSLTTSSALDAPRGLEFVLSRNRLNVALSRAQVHAHLVYSPGLLDGDVATLPQVRALGALLTVLAAAG